VSSDAEISKTRLLRFTSELRWYPNYYLVVNQSNHLTKLVASLTIFSSIIFQLLII